MKLSILEKMKLKRKFIILIRNHRQRIRVHQEYIRLYQQALTDIEEGKYEPKKYG